METKSDSNRKNSTRNGVNVYSYTRWSSDQQAEGDSLRRQEQLAQSWCLRRGFTLTDGAIDGGVSAKAGKNRAPGSGLYRLLKLVKPGDYLLVEDNDRFSRENWLTAMNYLAEIVDKGVTVVTLANGNEIDAESFRRNPGCFLPAILRAHLGNDENEKKSARIKASWEARREQVRQGKPVKFRMPCWLCWDDELGRPALLEQNGKTVRRMFELALAGKGVLAITRILKDEGLKLIAGQRQLALGTNYVWRTLTNKAAIGHATFIEPPKPGVYPAVVNEQTFYAVQARIKQNKRQTVGTKHQVKNLLTGLGCCSKCGGSLIMHSQRRNGKIYPYLLCSNSRHGVENCGMSSIRYDVLEKSFLALLANSDLVRRAMPERANGGPSALDALNGELATVEHQEIKYLELINDDPQPARMLYRALKDAEAKADELRQRIETERNKIKAETPSLESYAEFCERFAWRAQEPQFRGEIKALLRSLVDKITVDMTDRSYEVHFRGASEPVIVGVSTKPLGWVFRDLRSSPVHRVS